MASCPDDPLEILMINHNRGLAYATAVLGENHPLVKLLQNAESTMGSYLSTLTDLLDDTLSRWPIPKDNGCYLSAREGLVTTLGYTHAVTGRYAPVFNVLTHALQAGSASDEKTFIPFEYTIHGQTKNIKLHRALGYFHDKSKYFGNEPVPGVRDERLPFDIILFDQDPTSFQSRLNQGGVFDFLDGCLTGLHYLPSEIIDGLSRLDYIMIHDEGVGNMGVAFHPSNGESDCGNGICLTTKDLPWLVESVLSSGFAGYSYLSLPHEIRHAADDMDFPLGCRNEFVVKELRAFHTQLDTAHHLGWHDDSFTIHLTECYIPRHKNILLGRGWGEHGMVHADTSYLEQTKILLSRLPFIPNGAQVLKETEHYLESY